MRRKTVIFIMVTALWLVCALVLQGGCTDYKGQLEQANEELIALRTEMEKTKSELQTNIDELVGKNNDLESQLSEITAKYEAEKAKGKCPPELRDFRSEFELRYFLREDKTDQISFEKDVHDCEDFAFTLIHNAAKEGYQLYPYIIFNNEKKEFHWDCLALVNVGRVGVYIIDVQNDTLKFHSYLD